MVMPALEILSSQIKTKGRYHPKWTISGDAPVGAR
jgi:hypothetical protein